MFAYTAVVKDAKWGDTLFEGTVHALDAESAKVEAAAEYRAYVRNGYEPGDYKAAGAIVSDLAITVTLKHGAPASPIKFH